MNKGDTLRLNLNYELDGYDEIELKFDKGLRFLKSDGSIKFDTELGKYYVELTQEQTFSLGNRVEYQVRVKKGEEVHSSNIGAFSIGNVLSREVL